jgi:hypothetical protein
MKYDVAIDRRLFDVYKECKAVKMVQSWKIVCLH